MATFPHYVFDARHVLLGTFEDAEQAHQFAHSTSQNPGARLPVEATDPAGRTSRLVWADRCHAVRWLALERVDACVVRDTHLDGFGNRSSA